MALCSECGEAEAISGGLCNGCGQQVIKDASKKVGQEKIRPKGNGKQPGKGGRK